MVPFGLDDRRGWHGRVWVLPMGMEMEGMRVLKDERGQVMVLTVLCMAVLIGFVAFAVDVGLLLRAKRVVQTAADSAAIAAAAESAYGDSNSAALADAAQNGIVNGVNGATVVEYSTPISGSFVGQPNYLQVIVTQPQPTFFMRAFSALAGFSPNAMSVSASAVATTIPTPSCVYTLGTGPVGGVEGVSVTSVSGSAGSLTAPNCGILVDGVDSNAIFADSNTAIVAEAIGVVGGAQGPGTISPAPVTGITPVSDPLSSLQPPTGYGACLPDPQITGGSTQSFGAGGGIVCYNGLTVGGGIKTFEPGIYVINGPMTFTADSVQGTGVTIYFTPLGSFIDDAVQQAGLPAPQQVNLSAQTSGPYKDILFYEDPNNTNTMSFTPNNTWTLNGVIYLPSANLSITGGSSSASFFLDLVVGSFSFASSSTGPNLTLTPYAPLENPAPISIPRMAE